jgi:hypothetical protein
MSTVGDGEVLTVCTGLQLPLPRESLDEIANGDPGMAEKETRSVLPSRFASIGCQLAVASLGSDAAA